MIKVSEDMLQPYSVDQCPGYKAIVHNGTIANDNDLNKKFYYNFLDGNDKEAEIPIDSVVFLNYNSTNLIKALSDQKIIGSYSGALFDEVEEKVVLFKNYMPLHIMVDYENYCVWWANVKEALYEIKSDKFCIYDVPAYTGIDISTETFADFTEITNSIHDQIRNNAGNLYSKNKEEKALVVCSGGLDSTTVAALAVKKYGSDNVTLLHYHYGCKAEEQEKKRIKLIAEYFKCSLKFVDITSVFEGMKSPILGFNGDIATGDEAIEFAKEWVPARNTIMMSIAAGIAEDMGCSVISLGLNLTEQSAYPDNSLDFMEKFNSLLPYALNNDHKMRLEAPIVNLMKQEIVELGMTVDTPYHLTFSCYHDGDSHCKVCGPCTMRRIAFEKNGVDDPAP
jgi:7-cyano-7-deazaguanine synthase